MAMMMAISNFFIKNGEGDTHILTNVRAPSYAPSTITIMSHRLWFAAKRYGYGWYPSTWEGVLVTLGFVIGVVIPIPLLPLVGEEYGLLVSVLYLLWAILLTTLLLWICVKRGEKARWRWGN